MNSAMQFLLKPARGPAAIILIRLAVGLIFFTQGILKYIDPKMGVLRFARIGFSHPTPSRRTLWAGLRLLAV